jgi:hypothetical protein
MFQAKAVCGLRRGAPGGSPSFGPRRTKAAPIQRYEIVEWDGNNNPFLAQERDLAGGPEKDAFLSGTDQARVTAASGKVQLRVADDGQMAIEHSDLSQRQAKCFFATRWVIDNANKALDAGEGNVRLAVTGRMIRVPFRGGQMTLLQVVPKSAGTVWPDSDDAPVVRREEIAAIQFSQNCNAIAEQISGLKNLAGSRLYEKSVLSFTETKPEDFRDKLVEAEEANATVRDELVKERLSSDPAFVEARRKLQKLKPRLRELQATLESKRASNAEYVLRGIASFLSFSDSYEQTVQKLERQIAELEAKDRRYQLAGSRAENRITAEVAADDTLVKKRQSPLWKLAKRYVKRLNEQAQLVELNLNQFARADVGEVYQISHLATSETLLREDLALHDFARGEPVPPTNWGWHFATVVAVSGGDRITLENFARGDAREGRPDPRWYFQMYGSRPGQSFHEETASSGTYANPVTVVHRRE